MVSEPFLFMRTPSDSTVIAVSGNGDEGISPFFWAQAPNAEQKKEVKRQGCQLLRCFFGNFQLETLAENGDYP